MGIDGGLWVFWGVMRIKNMGWMGKSSKSQWHNFAIIDSQLFVDPVFWSHTHLRMIAWPTRIVDCIKTGLNRWWFFNSEEGIIHPVVQGQVSALEKALNRHSECAFGQVLQIMARSWLNLIVTCFIRQKTKSLVTREFGTTSTLWGIVMSDVHLSQYTRYKMVQNSTVLAAETRKFSR